ncbi:inactive histone-lysine N-methyltransferase 2E-like isoform X2 [Pecten maximus]|uniref:inactive histone-lysine N-methyltransferase 2E-like isoform X2 n=1 Tax=Pecten maximus TaxID=6579 RepID=UPI00145905E2|nr:inactive histone-lysine N-methyltransferase 2E-like isoform X2 [Pecten maximus]
MSVVLRLGVVHTNDGGQKDAANDADVVDCPTGDYYMIPQTYPGCFGLPYQDHNYGAPPPPTPPPSPPPQPASPPQVDKGLQLEVEDVVMVPAVAATEVAREISVEDDSITRCICDYTHDDGYMICCDKCSVWQHIDCMGVDRSNIPESYFCEICEPRVLDSERARQLQTKRKELLINDSSATDTDPEEAMNRQMSQQLSNTKKGKNRKKTRVRSEKNNPTTPNKSDVKLRRPKKEKKDNIKKEKENKEADKKQKQTAIKEAISKKINKSKLKKKPGLTLVMNENAQDPWDSSYSPWVDKYEEARENQYSPDIQALMAIRINGQPADDPHPLNGRLQTQLCHVTEVSKNRKGLEASETIGEGEPIIEYTGKVTLKQQFDKDNFFRQFNPFALFYNKYDNIELCVDATSYGSTARFIRRSCKANAEVRHVMEKGVVNFFIYSAKVIPRGSEITIPYDYNYKDCSYCVECACLRNNCPVAKYFKRKQNAQNKKDKSLPKTPVKPIAKSPVKSPTKSPLKSSIKKIMDVVVKKEIVVEESPPKALKEVPPPPVEVKKETVEPKVKEPEVKEEEKEEEEEEEQEQQEQESTTTVAAPTMVSDVGSDSEDVSSGTSAEKRNKMSKTREERKMEAIMKAFEKLEKREERRKEALARLEHQRHDSTTDGVNTSAESTVEENKEEKAVKPEQDIKKDPKEPSRDSVSEKETEETDKVEVPKRESKPKTRKARKAAARRKSRINTSSSRGSEIETLSAPVTPTLPVQAPTVMHTRKSRTSSCNLEATQQHTMTSSMAINTLPSRKRRFSSNCSTSTESVAPPVVTMSITNSLQLRRGRMSSSCSSDTTSQDESSNTLPSCPSTPLQTADLTTPPSFKFMKTKKHLMSEWLSEKTQDTNPLGLKTEGLKTEPLEVAVEDNAMFVTCLPSPRNSMDHLRRNSHSSGGARAGLENSIGSAKKRWLRQAMWDKPGPESGSMSPVATSGGASPNPAINTPNIMPSIPSPGASPPGDFVTPLKKRRFARESCDQPIPQTLSTLANCSSVAVDYSVLAEVEENGNLHGKPDYHPTPAVLEEEEDENVAVSKEAESVGVDKPTRGRDSIDSETCDSVDMTTCKNSIDLEDSGLEKSPETVIQEKSSEIEEHTNSFETEVTEKCSESEIHETGSNIQQIGDNVRDENEIEDTSCGSKSIDLAVANLSVTCNDASENSASNSFESDKSVGVKGVGPMESECDSIQEQRNLADSDMESRQQEVESELEEGEINDDSIEESMQVDSTEDSANVGGGKTAQDNKLALCDSTSKVDENKVLRPRMLETVQADCASSSNVVAGHSVLTSEVKEAAVVDSSTDTDQSMGRRPSDSDRVAILLADQSTDSDYGSSRTDLLNSSNQEVEPSHQSEESLVESVSDFSESVRHSSSSSVVSLDTSGEKVGSSSDEKTHSCLSDVSSSSERRNLASSDSVQSVVSSQTVDDFRRNFASSDSASSIVSSLIPNNVSPVVSSQSSDNVGVSSTELCASDATSNTVGNSDSADSSEAAVSSKMDKSEIYSEDSLPSVTGSICLPNTSEADTPSLDDFGLSDEIGNTGEASSSSSISEDSHLASSSVSSDPPPLPTPTKKKVSLLEYRKRLKEKSTPTGSCPLSSSSSSSQAPSSSYTSYPCTSPSSLSPSFMPSPSMSSSYNKPSSSTTSRGSSSLHNNRRLPSLPSLPLFDSSPPKDPSRYHFKSSSDIVRRKSTEVKKPAKPLSLTERLKQEFGFDDTEEEAQKEKNEYKDQGQEAQQQQQAPPQQVITHPPHHPGYQQPMYHPQPHTGQPPLHPPLQPEIAMHGGTHPAQPPHIMGQNSAMLNGPAPGMMPPHSMVGPGHIPPPVPNGQGLGQAAGMLPPHSHIAGVQAPPMQNGPGPAPPGGPSQRQGGKIPSLMSIQTFPSRELQPAVNSNVPPTSHSPQPQVFPGQHLQQSTDQGLGIAQHGILNNEAASFSQSTLQQQHPHTANHTTGYNQSPQGPSQSGFNSTINGPQGPSQSGFNSTINGPQGPNQSGFNSTMNGPQGSSQTGFNSTLNGNSNFNMMQSSSLQTQQQPPANGPPVVHEYNHGFNGHSNNDHKQHYQQSPSQYHSQGPVQRKSKFFGKKRKKGHNHQQQVYPDSGGLY